MLAEFHVDRPNQSLLEVTDNHVVGIFKSGFTVTGWQAGEVQWAENATSRLIFAWALKSIVGMEVTRRKGLRGTTDVELRFWGDGYRYNPRPSSVVKMLGVRVVGDRRVNPGQETPMTSLSEEIKAGMERVRCMRSSAWTQDIDGRWTTSRFEVAR